MQESRPLEKSNMYSYVDVRHFRSHHVDQEFRICIAKPPIPPPQGAKLPVIFGLDGSWVGGLTIDSVMSMSVAQDLPSVLVVTIGYPLDLFAASQVLRRRDLTPTRRPGMEKLSPLLPGQATPPVQTGGAANFVAFIDKELKPVIERDYGGDPNDATVTGSSLGGLFGAYALFNASGAFKRYNIVSPSIWWDEQVLVKQEEAFAARHNELDARVFMCAGSLETRAHLTEAMSRMPLAMRQEYDKLDPADRDVLMVELVEPFAKRLEARGHKKLEVSSHIFEGETHNSVYIPALSRGLRTLFGTYGT